MLNTDIRNLQFAVIDFETTGLQATRGARVVEFAVVHVDLQTGPRLALHSLVNPQRPIRNSRYHGITDRDVLNQPTFREIADEFFDSLSGRVVTAYNAPFDMGFLKAEFKRLGRTVTPSYFCLMQMRPVLDMGPKCKLVDACAKHGIDLPPEQAHRADADTLASAQLLTVCLKTMKRDGLSTFGEIGNARFVKHLTVTSSGNGENSADRPRRPLGHAGQILKWQSVESEAIRRVAYLPGVERLHVEFLGGQQYVYNRVPPHLFRQLLNAESIGDFFWQNIRLRP
jgi:DNA polymerase III epsilon subunit family exonuclease